MTDYYAKISREVRWTRWFIFLLILFQIIIIWALLKATNPLQQEDCPHHDPVKTSH